MSTLQTIAASLKQACQGMTEVELARQTGLTRQSIARTLSGSHSFNVTTLLAIAEATGQQVMIVPNETARAIVGTDAAQSRPIATLTDSLKAL